MKDVRVKMRIILAVLTVVMIASCTRLTKEDYLSRYGRFVEKVQREHTTYTERDWLKADKNLNSINGILVGKYGPTLTAKDKITMAEYRIRYDYCRYSGKIVKGISDYIDNDLVDDLDVLIRTGLSDTIRNIFGTTNE